MKTTHQTFRRSRARRILIGGCALLCLPAFAQEPELSLPGENLTLGGASEPLAAESLGNSLIESAAIEPAGLEVMPASGENMEQGGVARWRAVPHLDLRTTYDDNIFIQRKDKVADFIFSIAPGIKAGFWAAEAPTARDLDPDRLRSLADPEDGHFLVADYTAILLGFARTHSENSFDQEARLAGQWQFEKLTLAASSRFESRSETNVDVGDRIRHTSVVTELSGRYSLTEKTTLDARLLHTHHDYEAYLNATEWRAETGIDYALTPLLRASFGLAVGKVEQAEGSSAVFERILARAVYAMTEKARVGARGGVEFRQSAGPAGDRSSPIFSVFASCEPGAATQVEAEAFRRVEVSALEPDRDFMVTGVAVSARRNIGAQFLASIVGGWQYAEYTSLPFEPGRTDRYFFVRPAVLYQFARWGSLELSYQFRENRSTRRVSGFENHQTSLQLSLHY